MRTETRSVAAISLIFGLAVASCSAKEPTAPAPIPRVKVEVVGEAARELTHQIAGRLESIDQSSLSFGVGGTVREVLVKEGASVGKGQLLARLDADEFEARARSAESRLRAARARLAERMQNLRRREALLAEELVAQAEVDRLRSGVEQARGEVRAAESDKVRQDLQLRQTRIVAPMAGRITARRVEPFQEVMANQTLFELAGEGGLQAVVRLPESLIRDVYYGQSATVRVPGVDSGELTGRVSEIAAQSGEGNAFRVAIALEKTPLDLRPGMAANATLAFEGKFGDRTAFLIPLSALAVQEMVLSELERNEAEVFVYDPASGAVSKRRIRGVASLRNRLAITEGLEAGDHLVVAGVAFLHEGQQVALWEPPR